MNELAKIRRDLRWVRQRLEGTAAKMYEEGRPGDAARAESKAASMEAARLLLGGRQLKDK